MGERCRPTPRKTVPFVRSGRPMSPGAVPSTLGVSSGWTGAAITGNRQYFYIEGPRMQPVGGEHALAVEDPARSRNRTTDSAVRAANDCVQLTACNPSVTVNDGSVPPA